MQIPRRNKAMVTVELPTCVSNLVSCVQHQWPEASGKGMIYLRKHLILKCTEVRFSILTPESLSRDQLQPNSQLLSQYPREKNLP